MSISPETQRRIEEHVRNIAAEAGHTGGMGMRALATQYEQALEQLNEGKSGAILTLLQSEQNRRCGLDGFSRQKVTQELEPNGTSLSHYLMMGRQALFVLTKLMTQGVNHRING